MCSAACRRQRDAARKRLRRDPSRLSLADRLRSAYPDGMPDLAQLEQDLSAEDWRDFQLLAESQYPDAVPVRIRPADRGDIVPATAYQADADNGSAPSWKDHAQLAAVPDRNGRMRPVARGYDWPPMLDQILSTDPAAAWVADNHPDALPDWLGAVEPERDMSANRSLRHRGRTS